MSIIEIVESRIARALRGLRFPYRARLTARNDAPGLQLAQADALAGEQAQAVEVLQQFGFSSGVPEGSDLIVVPLGGRIDDSSGVPRAEKERAIGLISNVLFFLNSLLYLF